MIYQKSERAQVSRHTWTRFRRIFISDVRSLDIFIVQDSKLWVKVLVSLGQMRVLLFEVCQGYFYHSAPVWPPDMILVSIPENLLDVRRKFKGFDLAFENLYPLGAHHPIFVEISK